MAFSCGPTVKKPEKRNTASSKTITALTTAKLLRNASASACDPLSTGVGGGVGWACSCPLLIVFYRLPGAFVGKP